MNLDQIDEVWAMLDRGRLAAVVRSGPPPVFATVSGAHLYGFASADSDVDLRGAFLIPARAMFGLRPPRETITIEEKAPIDLDWVAHDIRKFARMMTHHNGYVLEQLFSPLIVVATPAFEELRELGQGCMTRPMVRHYQGFARGRRARLRAPKPTVKHALYAYRVLLAGIHLMQEHEIVSNLAKLNERFRLAVIDDLVARKRQGAEVLRMDESEVAAHDKRLDALEVELAEAHRVSALPEEPRTASAIDDFIVRLRLATI